MNCHLCGDDREKCGCWETVEEITVSDEELLCILAVIEKDIYQPTEH